MSDFQAEIIINIDDYDSNLDVKPENLVHQKIYGKLKDDIELSVRHAQLRLSHVDYREKGLAERYPPSSGLVFFIDGSRGAGKTTFLRTLYSSLPAALKRTQSDDKRVPLVALDYIDPSRLEGSEIILLNILRTLKTIVSDRVPDLNDEVSHECFRQHFKKLAGGLSLFRKGHDQLAHHDPELFFDRGLARAEDSRSLRSHLHSAIDTACQILGTDALLLAFDDADTNSRHAYPLLECIRNYLDTPRLVIVATGDMELYSLLVREQFSQQLPIAKNPPEEGRQMQHTRMLDHLEDQYLLKLFPLSRRYHLKTLGRLLENEEQGTYQLESLKWTNRRELGQVLDEIIRRGLRVRVQSDIDLFKTHLLKQPLRSILQLLQRCAPSISKSDSGASSNVAWDRKLSDALREALRAMTQGSLYKKGIVVDDLAANYLPALTGAVFRMACEDGDVDTAAYLRPQASDEDLNNCYMALAAEVAGLCAENPSAALTYLLAGPGSVSLWGKEKRRMAGKIEIDLLGRQFRQYMAVGRNEDALNWARRATAVLAAQHPAQPPYPVVSFGIIGLNKRKPDAAKDQSEFKTIAGLLKEQESSGLPTFAYSLLDVSSQSSRCYASIYNILGLIERLLRAADEAEVTRYLKSTYPQLSISSPDWGGSIDSDVIESESESKEGSTSGKDESGIQLGSLPKAILAWQKIHKASFKDHAPSSILLGKIWARVYFSLEKSSDASRPGKSNTGMGADAIMALSAACLINAFLVEEATHGVLECSGELETTNPLTSATHLKKKMGFLVKNKEKLPLTNAIASCPLILGLLDNDVIQEFKGKLPEVVQTFSVSHNLVSQAFIAGRWKTEK